jgi:hypothetical protein
MMAWKSNANPAFRIMSLKRFLASSGLLLTGALLPLLAPGNAKAVLNCTFGNTGACTGTPEGNLQFSNFSFSGNGAEGVDSIQISQTGPGEIYTIAFNAGGIGQFDTDATLNFTITPINGYTLGSGGASSTVNTFDNPLFNFVYTSSNLPTLTTAGNTLAPVPFTAPNTSSNIVLSWNNPNATASGTSLFVSLQQQPPATVPGPLPLLGAASAFGFARKLRNRTRTSA